MKLVTDQGPCNNTLRNCCIFISSFFLILTLINTIFRASALGNASTLIGFIIIILGNLSLLIGALREHKILVGIWLVTAVLFFIGWPIAVLGVIFNYGGYRQASGFSNIFLIIFEYVISLVIYAYCTRLVYSYFQQLRGTKENIQHAVVV